MTTSKPRKISGFAAKARRIEACERMLRDLDERNVLVRGRSEAELRRTLRAKLAKLGGGNLEG